MATSMILSFQQLSVTDCKDSYGNSIDGLSYTSAADCSDGFYYKCENGERQMRIGLSLKLK